jgi:hypothetical protein
MTSILGKIHLGETLATGNLVVFAVCVSQDFESGKEFAVIILFAPG